VIENSNQEGLIMNTNLIENLILEDLIETIDSMVNFNLEDLIEMIDSMVNFNLDDLIGKINLTVNFNLEDLIEMIDSIVNLNQDFQEDLATKIKIQNHKEKDHFIEEGINLINMIDSKIIMKIEEIEVFLIFIIGYY